MRMWHLLSCMVALSATIHAQDTILIRGTVRYADGTPLSGGIVGLKGRAFSTHTDTNGAFVLNNGLAPVTVSTGAAAAGRVTIDDRMVRLYATRPGRVRIDLFNDRGQLIRTLVDGEFSAGSHSVSVRPAGSRPANAIVRIQAGARVVTRRMILGRGAFALYGEPGETHRHISKAASPAAADTLFVTKGGQGYTRPLFSLMDDIQITVPWYPPSTQMVESGRIAPSISDKMSITSGISRGDYFPGEERHGELTYNDWVETATDSLSTFGVDVDGGSYTFGRKKINQGIVPDSTSVRVEEYINYFRQEYPLPSERPFSVTVDGARSPFRPDSLHLLRIGLQGASPEASERKQWNLTFLIDISGSMASRLEFVKECLFMLIDHMERGDRVSVCTYAGGVRTIVAPTSLTDMDRETLKGMIGDLRAGGSTAMAAGIQNAYDLNASGFIEGGVNRVVVCSDGDANVGASSHSEILKLIEGYVDQGITLSALGFGQGNYNDYLMEQLANKGNGNYFYVDSDIEARRLFTVKLIAMMQVIAKNVKIQAVFDPEQVIRYRLIGYENRGIADDDFEEDTTDAGEIGVGHTVTALYELRLAPGAHGTDLGTVRLRYQLPEGNQDIPFETPIPSAAVRRDFAAADARFRFTAAVGEYAEVLRGSPFVNSQLDAVRAIVAQSHDSADEQDAELLELIDTVRELTDQSKQ